MADPNSIPTIDLSPFFQENNDEDGKKKAVELIRQACSSYGFFQVVNHGVSLDLMSQALDLSKKFYSYPDEEKLKSSPNFGAPLPAGYGKQPSHSADKNEYLLMFSPSTGLNVYPQDPPQYRCVFPHLFYFYFIFQSFDS